MTGRIKVADEVVRKVAALEVPGAADLGGLRFGETPVRGAVPGCQDGRHDRAA
ncbi:hypothetical protein [Nonomuraea sp. NPDC049309]|uniref:hypothetical protein n=1 Tax=Nonomuraea sp. NPDC049309 TaxID=3364350 RepID=UPI0037240F79